MPPKKKAAPAKSRLGPKPDAGQPPQQGGIKAFFDVRSGNQAGNQAVSAPPPKAVAPPRADQRKEKENVTVTVQQHRAQKLVASKEAAKLRAVHARESANAAATTSAPRVQTRNATARKNASHLESILAEEYGQCSSQDILLGNLEADVMLDGRVMWTASPGKGVLSTENQFLRASLSPGKGDGGERGGGDGRDQRRRRQRVEAIEPLGLPIENAMEHGHEPDVFDALSTALNCAIDTRRESLGERGPGRRGWGCWTSRGRWVLSCSAATTCSQRSRRRVQRRNEARSACGGVVAMVAMAATVATVDVVDVVDVVGLPVLAWHRRPPLPRRR